MQFFHCLRKALAELIGGLANVFLSGHEYSLTNLEFAAHLEPNNATVKEKFQDFALLRKSRRPTVGLGQSVHFIGFLVFGL